jgi:hypothetical protein
MIYEEDLEEELSDEEIEEVISEIPITETKEEEQFIEPPVEPPLINEEQDLASPTPQVKKVRVGGFFGKEITIEKKNFTKEELSKIPETIEKSEQPISITSLKPPKRRGTGSIKLCRICGATIQNTSNCPTCGAKID